MSAHTISSGHSSSASMARGMIFIHSAPTALVPHIEWAIGNVFDAPVSLEWGVQPVSPGTLRAEMDWQGRPGSAAKIASAMRGWHYVRFEITEHATAQSDGERFQGTPSLGIHHCVMGVHGDTYVHEERLKAALSRSLTKGTSIEDEIDVLLGRAWDEELEPFRYAGDQSIRWLQTGSH